MVSTFFRREKGGKFYPISSILISVVWPVGLKICVVTHHVDAVVCHFYLIMLIVLLTVMLTRDVMLFLFTCMYLCVAATVTLAANVA